jgi:hypothetical protein
LQQRRRRCHSASRTAKASLTLKQAISLPEINMKPEFRFRLNGDIIPEIFIQPALVSGEPTGEYQIAVDVDGLGRFTIDDNSNLWDKDLPKFKLEYRNETEWQQVDPILRRISKDKGWKTVTPDELLAVLEAAGHIKCG